MRLTRISSSDRFPTDVQIIVPRTRHAGISVTRPTAELAYPVQPQDACAASGYFPCHIEIGPPRLLH